MSEKEKKVRTVIMSEVKRHLKDQGMMVADGVIDSLDTEVRALLDRMVKRASDNGRKTVQIRDF